MTITTNFRNFTRTDAIEARAQKTFAKLSRFVSNDAEVVVTFRGHENTKIVEVKVTDPGKDAVVTEARDENLYNAIDAAQEKAMRALRKRKEKTVQKAFSRKPLPDDALLEEEQLQAEMLAMA